MKIANIPIEAIKSNNSVAHSLDGITIYLNGNKNYNKIKYLYYLYKRKDPHTFSLYNLTNASIVFGLPII